MKTNKMVSFALSVLGAVIVMDYFAPSIEVSGGKALCDAPANKSLPVCAPVGKSYNLLCNAGAAGTIAVAVESTDSTHEKLTIGLTPAGSSTQTIYVNSNFGAGEVDSKMNATAGLHAIVSVSDLKDMIGNSHRAAGVTDIRRDATTMKYSFTLAAANNVYVATCTRQ